MKFSSSGTWQWTVQRGGSGDDYADSLKAWEAMGRRLGILQLEKCGDLELLRDLGLVLAAVKSVVSRCSIACEDQSNSCKDLSL